MREAAQAQCVIIGGGPAGLTAAIYLARFRVDVQVLDAGRSRAALIPLTRNHAGFPHGISGQDLLERMRLQAQAYGARIAHAEVTALAKTEVGFDVVAAGRAVRSKRVLLATGVTNRRPQMPDGLHHAALSQGLIRYCPVCDGYEVIDKAVGVIGTGEHAVREARFLRAYTPDLTLISPGAGHDLTDDQLRLLRTLGVAVRDGPARSFRIEGGAMVMSTPQEDLRFDSIYPAMGSIVHSDLARAAGAEVSEAGCVTVDAHQRTSVPGLYAAGDVVVGLDQISHAMGEAGVAATTICNDLREEAVCAQTTPLCA